MACAIGPTARVETWLLRRLKFGFSEVNSGTSYNRRLPALFNLADFAQLPEDAGVEERHTTNASGRWR